PAIPSAPAGPISIAAIEDVWIKVAERDGSRTYYLDTLKAGQSFPVPDGAIDAVLRTGRPEALKVLIGATALPPVGEPANLVRAYSLKRDALIAIATAKPAAASVETTNNPAGPGPEPAGPAGDSDQRPQP